MIASHIIKKLVFFILFILFGLYATCPWWLASLLKAKSPENWQIKKLEISYPFLSGFNFEEVEVNIFNQNFDAVNLIVKDLTSDFNFNDFKVSSLSVKLNSKDRTPHPDIEQAELVNLKEFNLNPLIEPLPVFSVRADKLEIDLDSNQYHLATFVAQNAKNNGISFVSLKAKLQPNRFLLNEKYVALSLTIEEDKSVLEIAVEQQKLAEFSYSISDQSYLLKTQLELPGLSDAILDSIEIPSFVEQYKNILTGQVAVNLEQNKQTLQLISKIKFDGVIQLKQQLVPLFLVANSASNQFPLLFKSNLKSIIEKSISLDELVESTEKVRMINTDIDIHTNVIVEQDNLQFNKNKVISKLGNLVLADRGIEAKNIRLESVLTDFNMNQSRISNVLLTTKIINADVVYNDVSDKRNFLSTKVSGIIKIQPDIKANAAGLASGKISGSVNLSEMIFPQLLSGKSTFLDIGFNDVDTTISSGKVELKLGSKNGKIKDTSYSSLLADLSLRLKTKEITGKGNLMFNEQALTSVELKLDKTKDSILIDLPNKKIPLVLVNEFLNQLKLDKLIKPKLLVGELTHSGQVLYKNTNQSQSLSVNNQLKLTKAKLSIGENTLYKVEINSQIDSIDPLLADTRLTSEKIELASGLKLTKAEAELMLLKDRQIEINNLSFHVMSAKVTSLKIRLADGQLQPSIIAVDGLSLTELLFFTELENIYAEGQVDLSIPVLSEDSKLVIKEATFKSKRAGVLKYNSGTAIKDKNIALRALENFNYKTLDGTLNYDKLGNYHIKLHLLGSNPELYNGYPVDFTINLSGQLSGLFKSTFLTGNFQEAILNAVDAESL